MADHAVGGVDRLVGGAAGQPADREPEHRRDDAVGKILGEAFDRRARDARLVERLGIAADDLRHRLAAAFEPLALERIGDALDVLVEAPLRDQRACEHGHQREAERQQQQDALDGIGRSGRNGDNNEQREEARRFSRRRCRDR